MTLQNSFLWFLHQKNPLHKESHSEEIVSLSNPLAHTSVQVSSHALSNATLIIIHTLLPSSCLTIFHVFSF